MRTVEQIMDDITRCVVHIPGTNMIDTDRSAMRGLLNEFIITQINSADLKIIGLTVSEIIHMEKFASAHGYMREATRHANTDRK